MPTSSKTPSVKKPNTPKTPPAQPCTIHHLAFENAAQANIISTVSNGKILVVNDAACKLLGYSKKELLTKSNSAILDTTEKNFKKMLVQRTAAGKAEATGTAIKKSGKSFRGQITSGVFIENGIEKSVTTISDMSQRILEQENIDIAKEKIANDNIASIVTKQKDIDLKKAKIVAHDILEAKVKADTRIAENIEWLKYIGKSLTHVILDWNLVADVIFIGEGFEKLFGYSFTDNKASSTGKNNCIHPDDKPGFKSALEKVIESNSPYWEHIYRVIRADGTIANVFERGNIIRNEDGKASRIIGVMQDISRHKQDAGGIEALGMSKNILVEKVKDIIIEFIHYSSEQLQINFSEHLSKALHYDYTYLANLFSREEGMSIRQYIICQKIERVKELILLDELTLTEIAWKLHYSSVAHLSNQFKKVTGVTPSLFKLHKHETQAIL